MRDEETPIAVSGGIDYSADDFRAATQLIERYGEGAALVASNHVSTARERGEAASLRRWSSILVMIERLQRASGEDNAQEGDPVQP